MLLCQPYKNAFSQTAISNPNTVRWPFKQQGIKDSASTNNKVCPFESDAGFFGALVIRHCTQPLGYATNFDVAEPKPIDRISAIPRQFQMDACN